MPCISLRRWASQIGWVQSRWQRMIIFSEICPDNSRGFACICLDRIDRFRCECIFKMHCGLSRRQSFSRCWKIKIFLLAWRCDVLAALGRQKFDLCLLAHRLFAPKRAEMFKKKGRKKLQITKMKWLIPRTSGCAKLSLEVETTFFFRHLGYFLKLLFSKNNPVSWLGFCLLGNACQPDLFLRFLGGKLHRLKFSSALWCEV